MERNFDSLMTWENMGAIWTPLQISNHPHWTSYMPIYVNQTPNNEFYYTYAARVIIEFDTRGKYAIRIPTNVIDALVKASPPYVIGETYKRAWALMVAREILRYTRSGTQPRDPLTDDGIRLMGWYAFLLTKIPADKLCEEMHPIIPMSNFDISNRAGRRQFIHWSNWAPCPTGTLSKSDAAILLEKFLGDPASEF